MLPGMGQNLDAFIEKWAASGAAERANKGPRAVAAGGRSCGDRFRR